MKRSLTKEMVAAATGGGERRKARETEVLSLSSRLFVLQAKPTAMRWDVSEQTRGQTEMRCSNRNSEGGFENVFFGFWALQLEYA